MTKNMTTKRTRQFLSAALSSAALLGVTLTVSHPAHAQRQRTDDERQQQRDDRRTRMQNMTPEQRMQAFQQIMKNMTPEQRQQMMDRAKQWMDNMTPEQRDQMMQNLPPEMQQQAKNLLAQAGQGGQATSAADLAKWNWIRRALTTAGYTDTAVQDAVVAFMQAQEKAHIPLQQKARTLAGILVKPDTPETQLTTELTAFRKAVSDDKTRYNTELAALDKKINFSKQPRLESLLSVIGTVGYEVPEIGGLTAVYPDTGGTAPARAGGNVTGRGGNRPGRAGGAGGATVAPAGNAGAAGAAPAPAAPVAPAVVQ